MASVWSVLWVIALMVVGGSVLCLMMLPPPVPKMRTWRSVAPNREGTDAPLPEEAISVFF